MPLQRVVRSGPQLREQDLDDIEAAIGCRLLPDHRRFLLMHNGGVPEPCQIFQQVAEMSSVDVDNLLGLWHDYDIIKANEYERSRIPMDTYVFATDAIGNSFVIKHSGKNKGYVYYIDMEDSSEKPRAYLIATSFREFLNRLE